MFQFCIPVRRWILPAICLLSGAVSQQIFAAELTLKSPDGKIAVTVRDGNHLNYSVTFRGKPVIAPSAMGITVEGADTGANALFSGKAVRTEINERYGVLGVHKIATNHCNSWVIPVTNAGAKNSWQLLVRVFNDGVANRYRLPGDGS